MSRQIKDKYKERQKTHEKDKYMSKHTIQYN